jgi:hypothetical protein
MNLLESIELKLLVDPLANMIYHAAARRVVQHVPLSPHQVPLAFYPLRLPHITIGIRTFFDLQ